MGERLRRGRPPPTAADLVAGILAAARPDLDPELPTAAVTEALRSALSPSAVWQPGHVPPDVRGGAAYGVELPHWQSGTPVPQDAQERLLSAWHDALPAMVAQLQPYLRVRVDTPADVRDLRSLGVVDGLVVVPSLDSRGRSRSLAWRWPFIVGVAPGPHAEGWLHAVRDSTHYGMVFDAEPCTPERTYDMVLVDAAELLDLSEQALTALTAAACVIVVGEEPAEQLLGQLQSRLAPPIAVAFSAQPDVWWGTLFHTLSHDVPVDAAVETAAREHRVDALVAGPRSGLDITASAHWFAAVAPDFPQLADGLTRFPSWRWDAEGEGSTDIAHEVRPARDGGADPKAFIPAQTQSRPPPSPRPRPYDDDIREQPADDEPTPEKGPRPRRLVARVYHDQTVVTSVLPPESDLALAVRIAVPEEHDVVADRPFPVPVEAPGPSIQLEVTVRGDVWAEQPAPQTISLVMANVTKASTQAVFPFTTPGTGSVVSIEIEVRYQGKPLQAAVFESAVRDAGTPDERPTLTTYRLSGPDEPTPELKPVDATLDGRGNDLRRDGQAGVVPIANVRQMLDTIEERISQVLGVSGAPDSFDSPDVLELLVDLAQMGSQLKTLLDPLDLDDARSININVNAETWVLPLELAYAGESPDPKRARLCDHVDNPPPPGEACDRATIRRVCPYAFWGLHRAITRTVWSKAPDDESRSAGQGAGVPAYSMLFASTDIADRDSPAPKPSDSVLTAAQAMFASVTRVTSWTAWRKAVRRGRPNLLVVLGHTLIEPGNRISLYIGSKSALSMFAITKAVLGAEDGGRPLVLLIACSSAKLGGPFGTLPGALTVAGAGAVVGTLSKIVGPQGAVATVHLLDALHEAVGLESLGEAVARARYTLVKEKHPIGLLLVSHGELDATAGV